MLSRAYGDNMCIYGGGRKGQKGCFLSGETRNLWHDIFWPSFICFGATTAIFPAIAVVCVGLRERFLLVVGMSFLLPLLCG